MNKRTGGAPTIRYFDLFLLVDNEKGTVTEFPAAAEIALRLTARTTAVPRGSHGSDSFARRGTALGRLHLIAAAAQTVRNAMQRELTATLGTVGATHVRFLFGFPFAAAVSGRRAAGHRRGPAASRRFVFWPWIFGGILAQIAATALMLTAMDDRSFVVTIAYIKTEPVQVALFGLILLGDKVTPRPGHRHPDRDRRRDRDVAQAGRRSSRRHAADLIGLISGAMFACRPSAIAAPSLSCISPIS